MHIIELHRTFYSDILPCVLKLESSFIEEERVESLLNHSPQTSLIMTPTRQSSSKLLQSFYFFFHSNHCKTWFANQCYRHHRLLRNTNRMNVTNIFQHPCCPLGFLADVILGMCRHRHCRHCHHLSEHFLLNSVSQDKKVIDVSYGFCFQIHSHMTKKKKKKIFQWSDNWYNPHQRNHTFHLVVQALWPLASVPC